MPMSPNHSCQKWKRAQLRGAKELDTFQSSIILASLSYTVLQDNRSTAPVTPIHVLLDYKSGYFSKIYLLKMHSFFSKQIHMTLACT